MASTLLPAELRFAWHNFRSSRRTPSWPPEQRRGVYFFSIEKESLSR